MEPILRLFSLQAGIQPETVISACQRLNYYAIGEGGGLLALFKWVKFINKDFAAAQ